jgi:hypothetical protein
MLQLRKLHIQELPLRDIAVMTETELEAWCLKHDLNRMGSWLLPQLVAHFGAWTLVKDINGSIDVKQTLKCNCESSLEAQAMWRLSRIPRTCLLTKQIAIAEYAVLTPLILAGFKRMQGVNYEQWRGVENLDYVVESRLLEAVNVTYPDLGSERLLEIRKQGLTQRSGIKAGQMKPAESTWSLAGIADTELGHLPKLTQTILTQIWLAHPSHRSNLMILDPHNWDRLPEPLIANNVFKTPEPQEIAPLEKKAKETDKTLLPWM